MVIGHQSRAASPGASGSSPLSSASTDQPDAAGSRRFDMSLKLNLAGRVEEIRADLAALERVDENALGPARDPGHALPLTLY